MRPIGDWSTEMILSSWSRPVIRLWAPGALAAAVQVVGDGLEQHLVDERGLARARHAGDAAQHAERDLDVDRAQVVLGGALDRDVARRLAPLAAGSRSCACRPGTGRSSDSGTCSISAGGALGDDVAAVLARAGTHVDDVVGGAHRALVVLDHEHRVAEVAQPLERADQLLVVALVQADRRLVEDVQHAHQRGPDLRRQADPLRLAARQRRRRPVHRQVADADVLQELQALLDLAQDQPGDPLVVLGELALADPVQRAARRQRGELVDRRPVDEHRPGLRAQPRALAVRARPQRHVLLDLLAREVGVGLPVAALEVGHDPLELGRVGAPAAEAVAIGDLNALAVGAVEEELAGLRRQVLPRRVEVDVVALGDRLRELVVVVGRAHRPRGDRPLADRQRRVGDDQLGVDLHLRAQPRAARAGAVRGVEGEDPRLELDEAGAVHRTGELLREGEDLPVVVDRPARSRPARRPASTAVSIESANRLRRSVFITRRSTTTAMSCLYFLSRTISSSRRRSSPLTLIRLKPSARSSSKRLPNSPLRPRTIGAMHHEPRPLGQLHHLVDDLLGRLAADRPPAHVAVGVPDPRPQQAQVVVDLGDRADRRARIARGRLLVDRDRRRQPFDRVDVRLVHLAQELACVCRQRLDVAPLALGVDRVERQRGLARSRQPRDHRQRVPRDRQADVLEIVLPGTRDDDLIHPLEL